MQFCIVRRIFNLRDYEKDYSVESWLYSVYWGSDRLDIKNSEKLKEKSKNVTLPDLSDLID